MTVPASSQTNNLPSTSISQPIVTADRSLLDLIDRHHGALIREYGELMLRELPTPAERERLASRSRQIAAILRPATQIKNGLDRIALALSAMFQGFPSMAKSDAVSVTESYRQQLGEALPAWAVERACRAVSSKTIPDLSPDFPPTVPRLMQIARTYIEEFHVEAGRIREVSGAKLLYVPSEEERARIAAGFNDLSAMLKPIPDADAERRKAERDQRAKEASDADIRRSRREAGLPPVALGGILVSASLAKAIKAHLPPEPAPGDAEPEDIAVND